MLKKQINEKLYLKKKEDRERYREITTKGDRGEGGIQRYGGWREIYDRYKKREGKIEKKSDEWK